MNAYFLIAGFLSLLVCLVHTFAGGRAIAVPLLNARDLNPVPKYVSYFCWHIVTIVLAMLAIMFAVAGLRPQSLDVAVVATAFTASFFVLGLAVPPIKKQKYRDMPQGWLFLPILVLGLLGSAGI